MSQQSATYFDTSVILAMLFAEESAGRVIKVWEESQLRVSSLLVSFECQNVSQRFSNRLPDTTRKSWRLQAESWLARTLGALSLHTINPTLLERIRAEPRLGNCRTLDAIHLGTALLYKDAGVDLRIATNDKRMISAAAELGLMLAEI